MTLMVQSKPDHLKSHGSGPDITTEQNFRYIHGTNIWILKIALLSQVFANQVTYIHTYIHTYTQTYVHT